MSEKTRDVLLRIVVSLLLSPIILLVSIGLGLVYFGFYIYDLTGWPRRKAEEQSRRKFIVFLGLRPEVNMEEIEKVKKAYVVNEFVTTPPWELIDFTLGTVDRKKWEQYVKLYSRLV